MRDLAGEMRQGGDGIGQLLDVADLGPDPLRWMSGDVGVLLRFLRGRPHDVRHFRRRPRRVLAQILEKAKRYTWNCLSGGATRPI